MGKEFRKKRWLLFGRQWEGLMLWTVCPLSNQPGGHSWLHLSVEKLCRSRTSSWCFLVFNSHSPLSPCWPSASQIARLLLITSARGDRFFPSLLSHTRWSERDENRLFQLGRAVESVCFRLPHCCCCSLCPPPPLRYSCLLVCVSFPPPPHSQHSRGGSGKRWVTFKHFHPFHSAADLSVPSSEVLIGGEELSLAGCQHFPLGGVNLAFWHLQYA